MQILVLLANLACLVFAIIVLIHAFKNAVWKGIVGLLCGFYLLYYAFVEFEHEKKGMIVAGLVVSLIASIVLRMMSGLGAAPAG